MDALKIIEKYYVKDSKPYYYLVEHSKMVTKKALQVARKVKHLKPDLKLIEEAAMLHDIGMIQTQIKWMECLGKEHYIRHGYLGRKMLEEEGEEYKLHALICERHMTILKKDIIKYKLPLPHRDMIPITIEEEIIAFADRFYSKTPEFLHKERTVEQVRNLIFDYGYRLKSFEKWVKMFDKKRTE